METKTQPKTQNPQKKVFFVELLEWSPGRVVIKHEQGIWKIREEDWVVIFRYARPLDAVHYFVHAADIVWLAIMYNYPIDEDLARSVAREYMEGGVVGYPPYERAWVELMTLAMKRLGYRFSEDDVDDDAFEEAVEAARQYLRRWAAGEVSLAQ